MTGVLAVNDGTSFQLSGQMLGRLPRKKQVRLNPKPETLIRLQVNLACLHDCVLACPRVRQHEALPRSTAAHLCTRCPDIQLVDLLERDAHGRMACSKDRARQSVTIEPSAATRGSMR